LNGRDLAGKEGSLFSFDQLDQKGFKQIYSEVLDKLDVLTECKH
jgi:heme oxygenase